MKKTLHLELHRHLDVSVRTETLYQLCVDRGLVGTSTSLESFFEKLIMRAPLSDLSTVLAQFQLFQKIFDRPEVFERIAFEVVEDCVGEGLDGVELRYSPSFVGEFSTLSWEEGLLAFHRGIARARVAYPKFFSGLICIVSRDYGTEMADRTVQFFLRHRDYFIGLDLAGSEVQYPCSLFVSAFKPAIEQGAAITIHAGEGTGPERIWEAIELLGARRIGHGIAAVQDPLLITYLREKSICLEMCPTSNWLTSCVQSFDQHPLPATLRAGVPVCISTDDPGIFGVTWAHEVEIARQEMGLTEAEIEATFRHAKQHTFLNLDRS